MPASQGGGFDAYLAPAPITAILTFVFIRIFALYLDNFNLYNLHRRMVWRLLFDEAVQEAVPNDESEAVEPVPVKNTRGRRKAEIDSFMWLFRSGEDGLPPIVLYKYTETRAKFHAAAFLNGFQEYLETDCYQGYNNLPGIRQCCYFAHLRRSL